MPGNTVGAPTVSYGAAAATYSPPSLFAQPKLQDALILRDQYNTGAITKQQYYTTIGNNASNPAPQWYIFSCYLIRTVWVQRVPTSTNLLRQFRHSTTARLDGQGRDAPAMMADIVLPYIQTFEEEPTFATITRGFV